MMYNWLMYPQEILTEGLREGDLEDLVLPLVSIDEYESKIDDDAIVVAFFVIDDEPAYDLMRFIEQTSADLIDTDVSPAPTDEGYFLVFAEFYRTENVAEEINKIVETLPALTGIDKWYMKPHKVKKPIPLDSSNIKRYIRMTKQKEQLQEKFEKWLKNSSISNMEWNDFDLVLLEKNNTKIIYKILGHGDCPETLIEKSSLARINEYENQTKNILGGEYSVLSVDKNLLAHNIALDEWFLLQPEMSVL